MDRCERCRDLEWTIDKLNRVIDELREDKSNARNRAEKAESEVSRLKPYEDSAKRSYDNWVTNPERGRSDE